MPTRLDHAARRGLALGAMLALTACGASPAEPAPTTASPSTSPSPPPLVATLEGLARGARDAVDPGRGVVFVTYATDASGEAPEADAQGQIRTGQRACGAALDAALARLGGDLAMRIEDDERAADLACAGWTCTFGALGEYDLTGELVFVAQGERAVLDAVVRIEGGGTTDEFRRAGQDFAAAERARLAEGRCAPGS